MSVFLEIPTSEWVASNEHAFAVRDRYPVAPGHTLIVTRRVVTDWFSANEDERTALLALVDVVKRALDAELHPDGYNVGFNAGTAAGQTVMHLHVHVIPRFTGDMDDPSGGVRHVIPTKGNYRRNIKSLASGGPADPFSAHIFPLFNSAREIAILAAFVQETGLDHIEEHARDAVARGARVRILTGDYLDITQASATLEAGIAWNCASTAIETPKRTSAGATHSRTLDRSSQARRGMDVHRPEGHARCAGPRAFRVRVTTTRRDRVRAGGASRRCVPLPRCRPLAGWRIALEGPRCGLHDLARVG